MTTQRKDFPEGAVLVIGGSGGAGEAICSRFAELRSDVVLTYHRNQTRATQVVAAVQRNLCLKRWGQASEVADAVTFLASNRALYTTGQVLSVDGGYGVVATIPGRTSRKTQ